jgi:hypothetical protein
MLNWACKRGAKLMSELDQMLGKTVSKVTRYGDGYLEIEFTDGSKVAVYTSSSSWLSVDFQG